MNLLMTLGQKLTPKNVTLGVIVTNMVCRPTITMTNKQIPEDTRRYTATREFFTEFFGFATTYSFATLVEEIVPKIVAKKYFNTDLTKELVKHIKNSGWDKLSIPQKNLKGVILGTSFVATAIAVAVLTPLLNNFVLNRMLGKIMGKKGIQKTQDTDKFEKQQAITTASSFKTDNASFNAFLQDYYKKNK